MKTWVDGIGKMLPKVMELTANKEFHGHPDWNRWYGLYRLDRRLKHKIKLIRRNGYRT